MQQAIVDAYALDFAKHAPTHDVPKLSAIWESLPRHLSRENKKFKRDGRILNIPLYALPNGLRFVPRR